MSWSCHLFRCVIYMIHLHLHLMIIYIYIGLFGFFFKYGHTLDFTVQVTCSVLQPGPSVTSPIHKLRLIPFLGSCLCAQGEEGQARTCPVLEPMEGESLLHKMPLSESSNRTQIPSQFWGVDWWQGLYFSLGRCLLFVNVLPVDLI